MFSGSLVIILSALSLLDLFILVIISKGIGILLIVVSQLASASFGFWKLKHMDFNLIFFLDAEIKKGEFIVRELWEEALILTGSLLLIVPGIFSDLIGIAFFIPPLRVMCLEFLYGK